MLYIWMEFKKLRLGGMVGEWRRRIYVFHG
jgi:hypothetical protein